MKKYLLVLFSLMITFQLTAKVADRSIREVKLQGAVNFRYIG